MKRESTATITTTTTAAAAGLRYISKYSAYDNFLNAIRNQTTKK